MIYLLLSSVCICILAGISVRFVWNSDWDALFVSVSTLFLGITFIAGLIGLCATMVMGVAYQGADVKAKLINREYGTDYTRDEIFYASDSINIIRELDRKRIEINGDIRRQRDPQRDLPNARK